MQGRNWKAVCEDTDKSRKDYPAQVGTVGRHRWRESAYGPPLAEVNQHRVFGVEGSKNEMIQSSKMSQWPRVGGLGTRIHPQPDAGIHRNCRLSQGREALTRSCQNDSRICGNRAERPCDAEVLMQGQYHTVVKETPEIHLSGTSERLGLRRLALKPVDSSSGLAKLRL